MMMMGGDGMAIASTLGVGSATVDLKVGIWVLARQDAGLTIVAVGIAFGLCPLSILSCDMGLGIRGLKVLLALLEMLDLAGGVFCTNEAAVQTADLVALEVVSAASYEGSLLLSSSKAGEGKWHLHRGAPTRER